MKGLHLLAPKLRVAEDRVATESNMPGAPEAKLQSPHQHCSVQAGLLFQPLQSSLLTIDGSEDKPHIDSWRRRRAHVPAYQISVTQDRSPQMDHVAPAETSQPDWSAAATRPSTHPRHRRHRRHSTAGRASARSTRAHVIREGPGKPMWQSPYPRRISRRREAPWSLKDCGLRRLQERWSRECQISKAIGYCSVPG